MAGPARHALGRVQLVERIPIPAAARKEDWLLSLLSPRAEAPHAPLQGERLGLIREVTAQLRALACFVAAERSWQARVVAVEARHPVQLRLHELPLHWRLAPSVRCLRLLRRRGVY